MKKKKISADPSVAQELREIFAQQEAFEYRILVDEQELIAAKSQYLELSMRVERSIFSEDERKEIDKRLSDTWKKIEARDERIRLEQRQIHALRLRLEHVRDTYEARRSKNEK